MRVLSSLTPRRWLYRRWHTLAVFGLAVLVMAAAALGPCFSRSVEEATVRSALTSVPVTQSGLSVAISPGVAADSVLTPSKAQRFFATPVVETEFTANFDLGHQTYRTNIVSRDDVCQHLHMVQGSCAIGKNAVVASTSTARAIGLHVGQRLEPSAPGLAPAALAATVVGLYEPFDATQTYWFDRSYLSSAAGLSVQSEPGGGGANVVDALFGGAAWVSNLAEEILSAGDGATGHTPIVSADIALIASRVRLGDIDELQQYVENFASAPDDTTSTVTTSLPVLLAQLRDGFKQAATVERVLTVQLVLLALIAFAVIVVAAAGQRGRELALARLRGRSPTRTAGQLIGELGGVVVVAYLPALAFALGVTALAGRWWLGPGATAELLVSVLLAAAAAGVVAVATIVVVAWRTSRLPISELLRDVPPMRANRGVGALEAAVATMSAAGLYLVLSGNNGSGNGISLLMPMVLAGLAGLLLGRLLILAAGPVTRRAWRHRRQVLALAAASVGRRRGYRLAATVLCISAALAVFAGQQGSIAAANRNARAAAETGAAVVLDVTAGSASALLGAVHQADPGGTYAAVVALPNTIGQAPVVAVDSRAFGNVASWGWATQRPSAAELAALQPKGTAPTVSLTATALSLRLGGLSRMVVGNAALNPALIRPLGPIFLELVFRRAGGGTATASFGPLPASASSVTLSSPVDCGGGCALRGMAINRDTLDPNQVQISAVLEGLTAVPSGRPVPLGTNSEWQSTTPAAALTGADGTTRLQLGEQSGRLALNVVDVGGVSSAQYLDLPVSVPALYAGTVESSTDALHYQIAPGLDASPLRLHPVGRVSFVPRVGTPAIIVDFTAAAAVAGPLASDTQIWLATDDPTRERQLVRVLSAHGIQVGSRDSAAQARYRYAHAAPALGSYLSVAVAVLAALVAVALLLLTVGASWRPRLRDRDSLRLLGLRRRTVRAAVLLELATVVTLGTALGAAVGVVGARLVLTKVPLFSGAPAVPVPVRIYVVWPWFAGLAVLLLAVLLLTGVLIGQRLSTSRVGGAR